jgi:predicted O-methyltransferase YrrM
MITHSTRTTQGIASPGGVDVFDCTAVVEAVCDTTGFLSREESRFLYRFHRWMPVRRCVEIGSFMGRSTLAIASGLACPPSGTVLAVDPHTGSPEHQPGRTFFIREILDQRTNRVDTWRPFLQNIAEAGLGGTVRPVRARSLQAATHVSGRYHSVFIDGDHAYTSALADLRIWKNHLYPRGQLLVHDYDTRNQLPFRGPTRAVETFLATERKWDLRTVVDTIAVLTRSPHSYGGFSFA